MEQWSLQLGNQRRAVQNNLTIGRAAHCDIVVEDHAVSRLQALLAVVDDELFLLTMGRAEVRVNGKVVTQASLHDGDEVKIGPLSFRVAGAGEGGAWAVRAEGAVCTVGQTLSIGGGRRDGLRIRGMPAGAFQLSQIGEQLLVEAHTPVTLGRDALDEGETRLIASPTHLKVGERRFELTWLEGGMSATVLPEVEQGISDVELRFEANGGMLKLLVAGEEHLVFLSELRTRLIGALLKPRRGYGPGDHVPDEVLCPMIWPGESRGRVDVNQVVHRTRQVFNRAGLDGAELIVRGRGGGSTALKLNPSCTVKVH